MQLSSGLEAELAWLLETECTSVLDRVRGLLLDCAEASEYVEGAKPDPLRVGEVDSRVRFAAALNGTTVEALQLQVELDRDGPLRMALVRGQRAKLVLPQLLTWRNLLRRALGVLAEAGTCGSLNAARSAVTRLVRLLSELMCVWPREGPPAGPSSASEGITRQMQPPLPPAVCVDVSIAGVPPRFFVSAYPSRDAQGAAAGVHASAALITLEASLTRAVSAQRLCEDLLTKLRLHDELRR